MSRLRAFVGEVGAARCGLVAVLFALYSAVALLQVQNPDSWFLLATGRGIAENGVPHVNPFAPEGSGYAIVVQQWGYCLAQYLAYAAAGWPGVLAAHYASYLAFLAALVFCARSFGIASARDRLDAALPTFALAGFGLTVARPHALTVAVWLYEVGAFERHRRGDSRYLKAFPLVALAHANLHVSMAPVDLAVALAYAVVLPGRARERLALDGYGRKLPALVALACAGALFCTPYGADGAALLVANAGGSLGFISECLPSFDAMSSPYGPMSLVATIFVALGLADALTDGRKADLPCLLMLAGAAALTVAFSRCWELLAVAWVPACAAALAGRPAGAASRGMCSTAAAACCSLALAVFLSAAFVPASYGEGDAREGAPRSAGAYDLAAVTPEAGVDALESLGARPGDLVVSGFASGGYLEWRGYRVTLDTRYEIWNPEGAKAPSCTAYADYVASSRGDAAAAARYVEAWADGARWALVSCDAVKLDGVMPWDEYGWAPEALVECTVVGYLDASPSWERVHGDWESEEEGRLSPYYVYRKV